MHVTAAVAAACLLPTLAACGSSDPSSPSHHQPATTAPSSREARAAREECARLTAASGDITAGTASDKTAGALAATLAVSGHAWLKELDAAMKPAKQLPAGSSRANFIAVKIAEAAAALALTNLDATTGNYRNLPQKWQATRTALKKAADSCAGS